MKNFFKCLIIIMFFASVLFTGCSNSDSSDETDKVAYEEIKETEKEAEPTENPQVALDNAQVLEYLALLGLDENCAYTLGDTFPTSIEGKSSYLVNVTGITEEDFAAVQQSLESNGFTITSDIMEDLEKNFRSYQYSNSNDLYIEFGFSYDAEYFDVHFVPIS